MYKRQVVTVVRRLDEEREATQAMTTQMTMGMITETTKLEIDTPTPIEMALETELPLPPLEVPQKIATSSEWLQS